MATAQAFPGITLYACGASSVAYVAPTGCAKQLGKIAHLVIIKTSYEFTDETAALEWATAETDGDLAVIPARGEFAEPSENVQPGFGNVDNKLISMAYGGFPVEIPNLDAHLDLLNTLNQSNGEWSAIFVTPDGVGFVPLNKAGSLIPLNWVGKPFIPAAKDNERHGRVYPSWTTDQMLYTFNVPAAALA